MHSVMLALLSALHCFRSFVHEGVEAANTPMYILYLKGNEGNYAHRGSDEVCMPKIVVLCCFAQCHKSMLPVELPAWPA